MPRIPEKDVEQIQKKADIVSVISRYIPVKKHGKEYLALCPFHDDHNESLTISPDKQIYKCFSCGAGGNVFTFVQKKEGLTWPEAVAKVAKICGYPLNFTAGPVRRDPREPLYEMLQLYADYCRYELGSEQGKAARAYLDTRRFTPEILEQFSIGYAPERSMIQSWMNARKLDRSMMEQTGLIRIGTENPEPSFYERILIPVHNAAGKPVGYTARNLPGSAQNAKYINTTSTELFDKSRLIFNWHRALPASRKAGRLILTEGAMDVIGLAKAGLNEGIACLGVGLSTFQLDQIASAGVPVVVFYDHDAAGQSAAWKFGQAALKKGIRFSIVSSDAAKDPDEIFISQGADAVKDAVEGTISFVDFAFDYLQSQLNLKNYEDRKDYFRQMKRLIDDTLEPFEQAAARSRLAEITGFPLDGKRGSGKGRKKQNAASQTPALMPAVVKGRLQAEKTICWAMLLDEKYCNAYKNSMLALVSEDCRMLSLYIQQGYRSNKEIDFPALLEAVEEESVRELLSELLEWPDYSACAQQLFEDSLMKVKSSTIDQQIEELNLQISQCEDLTRKLELNKKKIDLITRKTMMKQPGGL